MITENLIDLSEHISYLEFDENQKTTADSNNIPVC